MAKPKSPLLSLDARGSVASSLTFQGRNQGTIARKKPTPTDPYSLPQAYQRWLYRDYAYLWTLLSESEKQVYRTAGSRYHLTGFQYWMRGKLREVNDIVGMWHLDEATGTVAHDSSKNLNHGTVFGALPAIGLISNCRWFDGIDDRIVIPHSPIFDITEEATWMAFINPFDITRAWSNIISKADAFRTPLELHAGKLYAVLYQEGIDFHYDSLTLAWLNTWQLFTVTFSYSANKVKFYRNNVLLRTLAANNRRLSTSAMPVQIGRFHVYNPEAFPGYIDNPIIFNRSLDQTEIARWAERRYP